MQVAPDRSVISDAETGAGPMLPANDSSNENGTSSSPVSGNIQVNNSPAKTKTTSSSGKVDKPKQKRNKPTLSCLECVERKTKCDRGRPCVACVKRQSTCEFTVVANLMAYAGRRTGSKRQRHIVNDFMNKTRRSSVTSTSPVDVEGLLDGDDSVDTPSTDLRTQHNAKKTTSSSSFLFSNLPFSQSSPSNVFGVGSQHPFSNYWTCQGGLPEVITVLPSKEQADILIAKFYECVDPVYPFIHRRSFYSDYEGFWALSQDDKGKTDASLVALHYAMYALGTQFMQFPSYAERSQTAEFYCSAANQALRVYSYLNRTSMRSIQAMLLMAYFLMNDNHASDAYAWAGIHHRQTYAMRLHRDPELVVPDASVLEKQQRRKLWQAIFLHDTFLTVLLKMPPTATHSDVPVESLADENESNNDGNDACLGTHSRVENLMSISVIAPQICETLPPPQPYHVIDPETTRSDIAYMRSMWHLANLVQENLSSPCSLSMPIANNAKHKDSLVAAFRLLHKSFPPHLTTSEYGALTQLAATRPRAVRQNLFLTSCFHHCLMLLHASENRAVGVLADVKGALAAAHEALCAFFKLWALFDVEAGVWWEFQHRAFEESLLVANLLVHYSSVIPPLGLQNEVAVDVVYTTAIKDIAQMLEIMERYGGNMEMHTTRKTALHEAFQRVLNPV